MSAFLLTWNPDKWQWNDLARELHEFRTTGVLVRRWSCGRNRSLAQGDRVFFLKQGKRGRGLYASGYVQGSVFESTHFADPTKVSRYVTVAYDALLDPGTSLLQRDALSDGPLARVHWSTQGGGILIPPEALVALEPLWDTHVRSHGLNPQPIAFPDAEELVFPEGAPHEITVSAFERSAAARSACIASKGVTCRVCEFDFGHTYGRIGSGFIHVHHTRPLSGGGGRQRHTTVNDLEPVCPNCHNMIHRRSPPYGIQELRDIMRQQSGSRH